MYIGILKHAGKVVGGGMWPENGGLGFPVEETLDTSVLQAACFWPAMKVKKTPRQKDKSLTQSESSIHRFLLPTAVDLAVVGKSSPGIAEPCVEEERRGDISGYHCRSD